MFSILIINFLDIFAWKLNLLKFFKRKRIYWKFRKFIIYTCMFIVLTWSILQQQMSTCMRLFSYLKQQSFIYCILCIYTLSSAKKKLPWILTFIRCINCNHVAYMHVLIWYKNNEHFLQVLMRVANSCKVSLQYVPFVAWFRCITESALCLKLSNKTICDVDC